MALFRQLGKENHMYEGQCLWEHAHMAHVSIRHAEPEDCEALHQIFSGPRDLTHRPPLRFPKTARTWTPTRWQASSNRTSADSNFHELQWIRWPSADQFALETWAKLIMQLPIFSDRLRSERRAVGAPLGPPSSDRASLLANR